MFKSTIARFALLSMSLVVVPGAVMAQANTIEFENTTMDPIKLLNNTTVEIDESGNLTAQCVLAAGGGVCDGITVGNTGPVPAITLARTNGTGTINTGATLALAWTVANNADVCVATSSPVVSNWNGNIVSKTSSSANLTMSTAGTFNLSLECYNDFGVSNSVSVSATVAGTNPNPPTTVPACTIDGIADGNQFVQPTGFNGHMKTWPDIMQGATFPNGNAFLSPTGSYTLRSLSPSTQGPVMSSRFISVEIIPQPNKNYLVSWVGAQRQLAVPDYTTVRNAQSVFMSISRCAGDLRAPSQFSSDPSLKLCRVSSPSASFKFGTTGAAGQCPMEAGVKYYLNIAFVQPSNGLDPTEHTCSSTAGRCEVNINAL